METRREVSRSRYEHTHTHTQELGNILLGETQTHEQIQTHEKYRQEQTGLVFDVNSVVVKNKEAFACAFPNLAVPR
jgi:hypothetical protein